MRILDDDSDSKLDRISIFMTESEARELRDKLEGLLQDPGEQHAHVSNEDFQKEITVCLYGPDRTSGFSKRALKLIEEDQ